MTLILWVWALVVTLALCFTAWLWNRTLDELTNEPCLKCGHDPKRGK